MNSLTFRSFLTFFLFLTLIISTHAQILVVDEGDLSVDSSRYFIGSVNFSFDLNNRSATKDDEAVFRGVESNGDLVYLSDNHAYITINRINYFAVSGGPFISTGFAHGRVNFLRKKRISHEVFAQIQYDNGRNMPLRLLQGGGVRLHLLNNEKSDVYLGVGGMYERELWRNQEGVIIERKLVKTSNYINANLVANENLSFHLICYYQAGFDYTDDVFRNRVSGDAVLSVKINELLSLTTAFTAQFENRPIIPINKFIFSLTNGLLISF
ncbi:MAG: DUF481 domain-containing protein [Bacteroidota bacterium]